MPHPVPLCLQVSSVVLIGGDLDRHAPGVLDAELRDRTNLFGVVGEQLNRPHPELFKHAGRYPVTPVIGREAEVDVRIDRV